MKELEEILANLTSLRRQLSDFERNLSSRLQALKNQREQIHVLSRPFSEMIPSMASRLRNIKRELTLLSEKIEEEEAKLGLGT